MERSNRTEARRRQKAKKEKEQTRRTASAAGLPALKLRLGKVRVGKTWMWMLTNVLDKDQYCLP